MEHSDGHGFDPFFWGAIALFLLTLLFAFAVSVT
jgi:hypothetical protein